MSKKNLSDKIKRPQDIWNERHGLVSKSYKLYKSITEDFADSCNQNGVSQASQLTKLLTNYITVTKRRDYTMYIQEKYAQNSNIQRIIQNKLNEEVSKISDEDINIFFTKYYENNIKGKRFCKLYNPIEYTHKIDIYGEIESYVNAGAPEIIKYAIEILKTQISLSMLISDKILMPISLRQNYRTELDVNHRHGNSLFDFFADVLPYESYLIINDK